MKELTKKSIAIVDALHSAGRGQDVYDALTQVPSDNLVDMAHMIHDILFERVKNDDNFDSTGKSSADAGDKPSA
jgi:hypothetical protein